MASYTVFLIHHDNRAEVLDECPTLHKALLAILDCPWEDPGDVLRKTLYLVRDHSGTVIITAHYDPGTEAEYPALHVAMGKDRRCYARVDDPRGYRAVRVG